MLATRTHQAIRSGRSVTSLDFFIAVDLAKVLD
jgi:hypothetical protein